MTSMVFSETRDGRTIGNQQDFLSSERQAGFKTAINKNRFFQENKKNKKTKKLSLLSLGTSFFTCRNGESSSVRDRSENSRPSKYRTPSEQ